MQLTQFLSHLIEMNVVILLIILAIALYMVMNQPKGFSIGNYNYPVSQMWNIQKNLSKCAGYAAAAALSSVESGVPTKSIAYQHILSNYIYFKAHNVARNDIVSKDVVTETVVAGTTLTQLMTGINSLTTISSNTAYWDECWVSANMDATTTKPTLPNNMTVLYHLVASANANTTTLNALLKAGYVCAVATNIQKSVFDVGLNYNPVKICQEVYGIDTTVFAPGQVGARTNAATTDHVVLVCGMTGDDDYIVIDSVNILGISGTKRVYRKDMTIGGILAIVPLWNTSLTSTSIAALTY
jgi:hypothetical protein